MRHLYSLSNNYIMFDFQLRLTGRGSCRSVLRKGSPISTQLINAGTEIGQYTHTLGLFKIIFITQEIIARSDASYNTQEFFLQTLSKSFFVTHQYCMLHLILKESYFMTYHLLYVTLYTCHLFISQIHHCFCRQG